MAMLNNQRVYISEKMWINRCNMIKPQTNPVNLIV